MEIKVKSIPHIYRNKYLRNSGYSAGYSMKSNLLNTSPSAISAVDEQIKQFIRSNKTEIISLLKDENNSSSLNPSVNSK